MIRYRTIVADPPWPYETSKTGRFAIPKPLEDVGQRGVETMGYETMTIPELCALTPPAEDDAHLYLWTTNAFMDEAHDVVRAWGFVPKTICTYGKVQPDGRPSMKTGYYFRGATEHWIFAVRGSLRLQVTEGLPTLWLWPRTAHSVKPDAFYDLVEKASPGPYLELFARRQRLGWDTWGNEALSHVELLVEAEVRELRAFAAQLNPDLGPMFGRDVTWIVDEVLAQREVVAAADRLRARVEELDGKAWDFGRLNEAATYDDARAKYAAAVAVPEAEETPQ